MKKIDLHIHTVSTISDWNFEFSVDVLKDYVAREKIDVIAITNHNLFDKEQYMFIKNELEIKVFPGIEVDIESGHLLVITDEDDIDDFERRCVRVYSKNGSSQKSSMKENEFISIFSDLKKYLLVPHYDKDPVLDFSRVPEINRYFHCGEVTNEKKFISLKKTSKDIVPVLFSDSRAAEGKPIKTSRQTYVDVEELTLSAIRYSLMDRAKVALSPKDGNRLFDILDNGLKISTGLTVVLGQRSSGKSYTLDRINEVVDGAKYIKQFDLVSKDEEAERKRFQDVLNNKGASITEDYLSHFKSVVDDVISIDLKKDEKDLDDYLTSLFQAASEAEKQDIYAKCTLFSEDLFVQKDLKTLKELIEAVDRVIGNKEYRTIIDSFIPMSALVGLAIELRNQFIAERTHELKTKYVNDIVESIKNELQVRSANKAVNDIDFYKIMLDRAKIERFKKLATCIKQPHEIENRGLYSFKIVAETAPFKNATEMKGYRKSKISFADAYKLYDNPYEFLKHLKGMGLPPTELYMYFAKINFNVLNQYGTAASGGERSEFNLLQHLDEAARSSMLMLDEPESSFDNLFLKDGVNSLLKDLSKQIPVIITTHNSTIGASLHPDYIIYTQKEILSDGTVKYHLYGGYPSSSELIDLDGNTISRKNVVLDCLEAGEPAYMERRETYEILDN